MVILEGVTTGMKDSKFISHFKDSRQKIEKMFIFGYKNS
jgi:hypothetical protein